MESRRSSSSLDDALELERVAVRAVGLGADTLKARWQCLWLC